MYQLFVICFVYNKIMANNMNEVKCGHVVKVMYIYEVILKSFANVFLNLPKLKVSLTGQIGDYSARGV